MGITDVIVKVNPDLTGLPDPWKYETLKKIVDGLAAEGLKVVGLEGDPFDMSRLRNTSRAMIITVQNGVRASAPKQLYTFLHVLHG